MTGGRGAPLITDRLVEIAAAHPERELAVEPGGERLTYGQAARQAQRLACGLRSLGLGPGDIVILQLPNWIPFIHFHLALTMIGAVTVNVPIVYRERELGAILRLTGAKGLVLPRFFGKQSFVELALSLQRSSSGLAHVFLVGGEGAGDCGALIAYEAFMAKPWEAGAACGELAGLRPRADEVTVLSFTSGTTGELKGAMLSTDTLWAWNRGLVDRYGLGEDDRIFACSPLGHAVGFGHCLRMVFTLGASMVLLDRWEPARALELIHREGCSFMAAATPFLMDIVHHPALAAHDRLASLRLFLCGGATIPRQLLEDAKRALPHTFVSPLWGMTECGGVTTCPFDAPSDKLFTTDGLACGGMELKVVDAAGAALPAGRDGELMARGDMVALGYFRQPELTANSFLSDGFFRTGDQARMDKDGYIKITGRLKDLIIRGGVNVSPAEIENVLFSHRKIANVAVVGWPDPRLGERVCAFVVTRDGASFSLEEAQRCAAQAGLAKSKWPERIEVVAALPMTPSGKIQKFRLRELLAGESVASGQTS
jgi:cyclohexanecarboxylate-CoA ligase